MRIPRSLLLRRLLLSNLNSLSSRVLIVTNAEHGWIELTCKKFLPRLEAVVAAMDKTSARSASAPGSRETSSS